MLKGKTTLELNKATMIAAVQMYLDATFKESHVVTEVKASTNAHPGYTSNDAFTVEVDDGASAHACSPPCSNAPPGHVSQRTATSLVTVRD